VIPPLTLTSLHLSSSPAISIGKGLLRVCLVSTPHDSTLTMYFDSYHIVPNVGQQQQHTTPPKMRLLVSGAVSPACNTYVRMHHRQLLPYVQDGSLGVNPKMRVQCKPSCFYIQDCTILGTVYSEPCHDPRPPAADRVQNACGHV
jgi:hypothetical protein